MLEQVVMAIEYYRCEVARDFAETDRAFARGDESEKLPCSGTPYPFKGRGEASVHCSSEQPEARGGVATG